MAPREIYDFVSTAAADVDETLTLTACEAIPESGDKKPGRSRRRRRLGKRVSLDDNSEFYIRLRFAVLSEADAGTLLDLWHDPAKANGRANSFKFAHPTGIPTSFASTPTSSATSWPDGSSTPRGEAQSPGPHR